MWRSSAAIGGSPSFTIKATPLEDGTWEAMSPSQPTVTPTKGATEAEAVWALKHALQDAVMKGDVH